MHLDKNRSTNPTQISAPPSKMLADAAFTVALWYSEISRRRKAQLGSAPGQAGGATGQLRRLIGRFHRHRDTSFDEQGRDLRLEPRDLAGAVTAVAPVLEAEPGLRAR